MKHYVYEITNNISGKYYRGVHSTDDLNDGYMGSGILIMKAIEKHGAENFTKVILEFFDTREEALAREAELVTMKEVNDPMCYNLIPGGNKGPVKRFTDEELREHNRKACLNNYANNKNKYRERGHAWYIANKDKAKEYYQNYYEQNRERVNEYHRIYQQENRKEYQSEYQKSNKDHLNKLARERYQRNKERIKEYKRKQRMKNKQKENASCAAFT